MKIVHTEEVRLFREVSWVEQNLVQKIVATVKEDYLTDTCNRTTNWIKYTMAYVITHLLENYDQLMPHKFLDRKDIVKRTTYHPWDLISTVLSDFKEILEFANITVTSYTQLQALNIAYDRPMMWS